MSVFSCLCAVLCAWLRMIDVDEAAVQVVEKEKVPGAQLANMSLDELISDLGMSKLQVYTLHSCNVLVLCEWVRVYVILMYSATWICTPYAHTIQAKRVMMHTSGLVPSHSLSSHSLNSTNSNTQVSAQNSLEKGNNYIIFNWNWFRFDRAYRPLLYKDDQTFLFFPWK